ncbi:hypothetical protein [Streptomyces sp. NPDC048349]|uniref:hypothetical protein n=1 Tax=Streptomyces sp. NPDC048349 TaxID=3155486 RepID=UPI00342BDC7B
MKDSVAMENVAQPGEGAVPGLIPRVLLAAVPVLSLGMLGAVPSLVIAWRRGARADWLAALAFTAATVGWWFQAGLTPEETHGLQFGLDALLLSLSTVGAAVHCLFVKQSVGESR